MSKPLRRPMFRMGGSPNTNSGIVSGFGQPRRNFVNGSRQEDDAMFDDTSAANKGIGAGTTTDILGTQTSKSSNPAFEKELAYIDENFMAQKTKRFKHIRLAKNSSNRR